MASICSSAPFPFPSPRQLERRRSRDARMCTHACVGKGWWLIIVPLCSGDTRRGRQASARGSFGCSSCSSCCLVACYLGTVASKVESGHWTAEMRPDGVKRRIAFRCTQHHRCNKDPFRDSLSPACRAVPESHEPIIHAQAVYIDNKRGVVSARGIRFCLFWVSTLSFGGQTSVESRPCRPCEGPVDTPLPRTLALIQWA